MARKPKYSQEEIQGFLDYAKKNEIGIFKALKHFGVNRRTFYLTCYRYDLNTDGVRVAEPFNTKATDAGEINKIIEYAKAKRIAHKKACDHFGFCYSTFRGAIIRLHLKAERYSNTYSREDVQKVINYAKANHLSMSKACKNFNYKYGLISTSAKRYNVKLDRELVVFDEAKELSSRDLVHFYQAKGYRSSEIYHLANQSGRKLSRQIIDVYFKERPKEQTQTKMEEKV